jgi:hypothetical protein
MNCVSPPELDDRQLLAYLDGEADHAVAAHLEQCGYCREKARQLARLQARLRARLHRLTCPLPMELGESHLRLLAPAQATAVDQHLRECPHCAQEVAQLRGYLNEPTPAVEPGLLERVKVLVARLVGEKGEGRPSSELAFAPAFVALRGTSQGPITLEADGLFIVLDVQPATEGRVNILGQIAADDQDRWTGAAVELRQSGTLQMTVTVDDLGAFRCEAVLPGPTELQIIPGGRSVVVVSNIEISI